MDFRTLILTVGVESLCGVRGSTLELMYLRQGFINGRVHRKPQLHYGQLQVMGVGLFVKKGWRKKVFILSRRKMLLRGGG